MATTASYIPVWGNFDPAAGFSFVNSIGDLVPAQAGPGMGPPRPGKNTMNLAFVINAGPIGDDATFTLSIPTPQPFTQAQLDAGFNALLPGGSLFYIFAGAQVQEIILPGAFNVAQQTFDLAISFGNPLPQPFGISLTFDFGWSAAI